MQDVVDGHETLSSAVDTEPAGVAGVISDHPLPFHFCAVGLLEISPTVTHEVDEAQDTPRIALLPLPSAGGGWIDHAVPFHVSTRSFWVDSL